MLHAILITSQDQNQALKLAQTLSNNKLEPQPDLLILTSSTSIGIDQVKSLEKFLNQKPYQNPQKIVLIPQASILTLPAQQALLKTLEEPPAHSLIILIAPHQKTLLPTIISRCELHSIQVSSDLTLQFIQTQKAIYNHLIKANLGQRINFIADYASTKIIAIEFCQQQLKFLRQQLLVKPDKNLLSILSDFNLAINRLNHNLNPKLCLEQLVFHYPNSNKTDKIDSG
ncbi:MAG: hypothetical protein V1810_03235 [Candidatus Beckwithbacteria bacterium]